MQNNGKLYHRVVRITHGYLGPAANRFIDRQVQNHLQKEPQHMTAHDLHLLLDWIRIAVSLLTDDERMVEEYIAKLEELSRVKKDQKGTGKA